MPLAEFSYNNSYQASLKMAPFEALYGCRCRTLLSWSQPGERTIYGPDLVREAEEKVRVIQENLKAASPDKRAILIRGEDLSNLRLEILYTFEYRRLRAYNDLE